MSLESLILKILKEINRGVEGGIEMNMDYAAKVIARRLKRRGAK